MFGKRFLTRLFLVFLLLVLLAWFSRGLWFPALAHALVHDDGPAKADIGIVLAGDNTGNRILKGADLVRAGYVPLLLVSGPEFYDMHESDAEIAMAVHKGFPAEWFVGVPNSSHSTREESVLFLKELRARGVHSVLLVTSNYHTARAGRIFRATIRAAGDDITLRTVAAPNPYFDEKNWWHDREGLKMVFIEWSKTIATAMKK